MDYQNGFSVNQDISYRKPRRKRKKRINYKKLATLIAAGLTIIAVVFCATIPCIANYTLVSKTRAFVNDTASDISFYDNDGNLLYTEFSEGGQKYSKIEYTYKSGVLDTANTYYFDSLYQTDSYFFDAGLLHSITYYSTDGEIIGSEQNTYENGKKVMHTVFNQKGEIVTETAFIYEGELLSKEILTDKKLGHSTETTFFYSGNRLVEKKQISDGSTKTVTTKYVYNQNGDLISEESDSEGISSVSYSYNYKKNYITVFSKIFN